DIIFFLHETCSFEACRAKSSIDALVIAALLGI
ncbi:hypothetical protein Tsp_10464, partial [Trichinella spiralis]